MKRKLAITLSVALVGLLVAGTLAFIGKRDTFFHLFVEFVAFFVGIPLFAIGLGVWRSAKTRKSELRQRTGISLMIAGGLLMTQWAAIPLGREIAYREIQEAQSFCESLIPSLENYKQINQKYPENLDAIISSENELPDLLKLQDFYSGYEDNFQFSFIEPDSFIDRLHVYKSETHMWHVED